MLEARADNNESPVNNQNAIEFSKHDIIESKLLTTISQIDPKKLQSINHDDYILSLANTLSSSLDQDWSQLLLFIQAIKDCGKACYKRDVLIETLNELFIAKNGQQKVLLKLLCDIAHPNNCDYLPWKEMANAIVTLPDLVANCGSVKRFSGFIPKNFYDMLLETTYRSLSNLLSRHESCDPILLRDGTALFYAHLIGRIAIAGFGTLVWNKFTGRLCTEAEIELRRLGSSILCIPVRIAEFEIFIEPLYGPIFYHMRATPSNGKLIEAIIGTSLLHNETLQHIVCKKYILQTNFNRDRHRQNLILYNIFSYLSRLAIDKEPTATTTTTTDAATSSTNSIPIAGCSSVDDEQLDTEEQQTGSNILIKTVLEVAKSWSNSTKILLRPYEHNRYIGCALVMALKFALEREHKQCLLKRADEIQSEVIRGLQIYLNRSSSELRNVAMCVAEIALTRLHDLMDAELGKESKKRVPLELNVEWDESSLDIKRMFQLDIDSLCKELNSKIYSHDNNNGNDNHDDDGDVGSISENRDTKNSQHHRHQQSTVREAASDGPADSVDDSDNDVHDADSMDAPIYLNDCISGLVDNENPRYVKICLVKVGELIRQLSEQQEDETSMKIKTTSNSSGNSNHLLKKSTTNDAIRDVAMELAQILLHLEDQYSIDNFDSLQRSALVSLTVAATDLVAKYLLDELNNQPRNIRFQTIILQTLIESAQQLGTRFAKFGALYFYGMIHQLKISTLAPCLALPSSSMSMSMSAESEAMSIVSAVKSMKADQLVASDDSYLLSRVLLSVSLIIKCLNQQLITCKLSNDLLDILAAYRHHPDSGVRKAIISCLTVIRDCTPAVYFREHLNDKIAHLFGAWLAMQSEFIKVDK